MGNTPKSNVTKIDRNVRRELEKIQEEWRILQVELTALNDLLKASYFEHQKLTDETIQAVIAGLDRRLEKMKQV